MLRFRCFRPVQQDILIYHRIWAENRNIFQLLETLETENLHEETHRPMKAGVGAGFP